MFVIFLIILIVGYLVIKAQANATDVDIEPCKPHHWIERTPDGNGYLICSKCGKYPGNME